MLTRHDLERFFTYSALDKAEELWGEDRIDAIDTNEDCSRIRARVRGSRSEPYQVDISVTWNAERIQGLSGRCTCPMRHNCKHVAAALLSVLDDEDEVMPESVARGFDARRQTPGRLASDGRPPPLPHDVQLWLEQVARAPRGNDYPPEIRQRLIYLLQPLSIGAQIARAAAVPRSVRLLQNGEFADQVSRAQNPGSHQDQAPRYYRDSDLEIFSLLLREPEGYYLRDEGIPIRSAGLIERMVATGRAYWKTHRGSPLRWGGPRPGRIEWRLASAAGSRPHLIVDGAVALNADPPVYVDERAGEIGPVELGLTPGFAYRLLSAPVIAPAYVAEVARRLTQKLPAISRDLLPAEPAAALRIDQDPVPVLRLMPGKPATYGYFTSAHGPVPVARLCFRYGAVEIDAATSGAAVETFLNGRLYSVVRRPKREKPALKRLKESGLTPAPRIDPFLDPLHRNDFSLRTAREWLAFLDAQLPTLRRDGFEIQIDERFPYRLATSSGMVDAEFVRSGIDWFQLDMGVEIEGERRDLVPALIALLGAQGFAPGEIEGLAERDQSFYLPLGDGRYVALAAKRLLPLVLALHAARLAGTVADRAGRIAIRRADVVPLLDFETADFSFRRAESLHRLAGLLRREEVSTPAMPPDFKAVLRPYQAAGVAWLDLLREAGLGGILADDMGLGKTVQVLALLALEQARGGRPHPSLVVCPTSLVENWRNEAHRFAPALKVLVLHGLARKQHFGAIPEHHLVITTYPLIARDREVLLSQEWHMAFLDEAQVVKNPAATTTRSLRDIRAAHRFCLTGTPMENHLGELWSLMTFANPGYLGDKTAFSRTWRTPIEKRGDQERAAALRRRLRPFLLRRTKGEVATELPPKTEIVESIVLEGSQRDLYDAVRISMAAKVREAIAERGLARSHIIVLEALLKMRQVCCDPRLLKVDDAVARQSAKLERLMEMVPELLSESRKIIVFSQFTAMLELIRRRFDAEQVRYSLLTGETRNRQAAVDRFQDGTNDAFLVSLKAGGVGLNLTAADTVVIFDPWWNPAVEEQAIDRAHRIGQDKAVFVYRLMAAGTIEEKMDELKARKRALADGLYDREGGVNAALTEEDVAALFEP